MWAASTSKNYSLGILLSMNMGWKKHSLTEQNRNRTALYFIFATINGAATDYNLNTPSDEPNLAHPPALNPLALRPLTTPPPSQWPPYNEWKGAIPCFWPMFQYELHRHYALYVRNIQYYMIMWHAIIINDIFHDLGDIFHIHIHIYKYGSVPTTAPENFLRYNGESFMACKNFFNVLSYKNELEHVRPIVFNGCLAPHCTPFWATPHLLFALNVVH